MINKAGYLVMPSDVRDAFGSPTSYPSPKVSTQSLDDGDVVSVTYVFVGMKKIRDLFEKRKGGRVSKTRGKYKKGA